MKYIFFDIDGTLLDNEKGIVESTVDALHEARAKGHKLFINTGRSYAELGTGFEKFEFDGLVCASGSYIILEGKLVFNKFIPHEKVLDIVKIFDELGINYGLEGVEYTYFTEPVYQGYRERVYKAIEGILSYEPKGFEPYHYMLQPAYVRRLDEFFKEPTEITKFLVYSSSLKVNNELAKRIPDEYYLIIYDTFAELINKGHNKATGIKMVLDYYGAEMKDSIAIGDSLNDLEMLKEAGIGIAMGNANDIVKSHADIVAPHIQEDGIYKVLKQIEVI